MNNKITTLLFDLDGTLIDTNDLIIQSFLHTLEQYFPGDYKREDVFQFMGPSLEQTFSKLNPDKVEEMTKVYRKFNKENHDLLVTEFPDVLDTMVKLKQSGLKMAVVTTKISEMAKWGLDLTKLTPYFDDLIALEHVKTPKPDPEAVLLALDKLGAKPSEAIMVGDNHHDILAGKNAGVKTAAVSWSLKGEDYLQTFEPDYMLHSIKDILPIVGVDK